LEQELLVPTIRLVDRNRAPVRAERDYVLYWMIATRRTKWNFALDRAAEWSLELGKPILILEALRCNYPWACDRIHRFVIEGMRDNSRSLSGSRIGYYPYIEPHPGAGRGLLAALAAHAAVVVTDEFPCFFLPQMVATAGSQLDVRLETVDSNGMLPLRATERPYLRAFDFRRHLQRHIPKHLRHFPRRTVQAGKKLPKFSGVPKAIRRRWPALPAENLSGRPDLSLLPIDHSVSPIEVVGGYVSARSLLRRFVAERIAGYVERRHEPATPFTSELSGHLHFGHISAHQIFDAVARSENWTPRRLGPETRGSRSGWWNMSAAAEAFLDQLVTWRELGYNFCFHRDDHADFASLPKWAHETLEHHRSDQRPFLYDAETIEQAKTHDEVWNAAQRELLYRGRIHTYLRMLWGKKILHWTHSPRVALDLMIQLNNRYAIDGRDPNSYSGIFWVLGRFDRVWGPERPVFGKVRYMSSKNTRRKLRLDTYLERWQSPDPI
jgi:deoxyribodipyrimidine photo-lyase